MKGQGGLFSLFPIWAPVLPLSCHLRAAEADDMAFAGHPMG